MLLGAQNINMKYLVSHKFDSHLPTHLEVISYYPILSNFIILIRFQVQSEN